MIEIGCGKGDFISLMSELGDNQGIGIDPAWSSRSDRKIPRVRFIKEFYSEKHGDLQADCIACRHTLEHIHDTYGFLETIKEVGQEQREI
ncbi:MAG: methyltransferase domain-containing protein [Bacteroidales bacterium]